MIRYECDRCGVSMGANDHQRYIVRIEVFAAADHVDLDAETACPSSEDLGSMVKALAEADPCEVEDRTYRFLRFDLCDACRRELLRHPLGR